MSKAGDRRLTTAQKDQKAVEVDQAKLELQRKTKDLNEAFSTPAGKRALRHIMKMCGYDGFDAVTSPATGCLDADGTLYNTARRSVYAGLRRYIRPETLSEVEIFGFSEDPESIF